MFPSLSCNWVSSQCDCAFSLLFLEITARAEVMFSGGLLETWHLTSVSSSAQHEQGLR